MKIIEAIDTNPKESRRELLMWFLKERALVILTIRGINIGKQYSHPVELNTNEKLDQRLHYIHNNPVAAGIVSYPEDYLYSSAGNYAKLPENLLDVMLI